MIRIAEPLLGKEESEAVQEVLASGMLAQGPKVAELEKNWATYCGTAYALAVSSGTAALHCALFAAGVGPGDEVITVPFSFIATINPIIMMGATPILCDIDPVTFNVDPTRLEAAITSKTKAIIVVDLYGQPADWEPIKQLCRAKNIVMIEDACQAIGATYQGIKAGNFGDIGCFSLYATKNIMSGEGGMVTTNNQHYVETIKRFRQHGMSGPYQYEHLGYNYRLTDLQAAIAVEQLKKVELFTAKRQQNAQALSKAISGIPGIETPIVAKDRTHAYHQYTIRLTSAQLPRETFIDKLKARDIIAGIYYPKALHSIPHIATYGYKVGDFPESETAAEQVVSLPVHPNVTSDDIQSIGTAVKEIVNA